MPQPSINFSKNVMDAIYAIETAKELKKNQPLISKKVWLLFVGLIVASTIFLIRNTTFTENSLLSKIDLSKYTNALSFDMSLGFSVSNVTIYGCTDPSACNYNSNATVNDGSCAYPTSNSSTQTACDSYTWSVNGTTYSTSGTFTDVSTNPAGCTHTETLNLTINSSTSNSTTQTACDSYTWSVNGTAYSTSGTYTDVSTNANGCDHTETLNLIINSSTSNSTTATACDSYTWSVDGNTYTTSGTYTDVSTNAAGCTHTETINITMNNSS